MSKDLGQKLSENHPASENQNNSENSNQLASNPKYTFSTETKTEFEEEGF